MRSHTRTVLSALAVGAVVVGGPMASPMTAQGSPVAGTSAAVESVASYASGVPAGLRRPGHEGIKARLWGFAPGQVISVDVNPTLPGRQSYKVKLQVKRNGTWVTLAVKRTKNSDDPLPWLVRGRSPHEMTWFVVGQNKPSKYRIVLKAQHGFERTVSRVRYVS